MTVNKDTTVCISISSRPSNFGTTLHNAAYRSLGLNFLYKAFGTSDLQGTIAGVRALGIRGCSVSMPFKIDVLPLLDALDRAAERIGSVNTIVNDAGVLTGFNTDAFGARNRLALLGAGPETHALVLGAGGVARAVVYALHALGVERISVAARNMDRIASLQSISACEPIAWQERESVAADLLVNATPIGMQPDPSAVPVSLERMPSCISVMDVVTNPLISTLVDQAQSSGRNASAGFEMSLDQLTEQFRLYTGVEPPREVLLEHLKLI